MAIIKQLKSMWGIFGTIREITDVLERPKKTLREAVSVGMPGWDPPGPEEPPERDQATVDRVSEVIGMGTVEEMKVFNRVVGTYRKITTGAPQEPPPEEERRALPAGRQAPEEVVSERSEGVKE